MSKSTGHMHIRSYQPWSRAQALELKDSLLRLCMYSCLVTVFRVCRVLEANLQTCDNQRFELGLRFRALAGILSDCGGICRT